MFGRVAVSRSARAIASGRSDARPSTTRNRAQVVAGLAKLRADVGKILKDTCARKLLDDLRLNYSVLWEPVSPEMLRVRGAMAHPLNVATC